MIYLNNTQEAQVLFVPRNGRTTATNLSLKLRNTIDQVFTTKSVLDLNTSDLYFNLSVVLPAGMESGEYEYSLFDGEILLSTGLLVIEESASISQYNKTTEYEQYKSE